jgi:uncharacterized protein YndB with AHSA1/START domain
MSDSERGYTIVRTIQAPRELVWRAWTDPERFARWWGTAQVRVEDVEMEVRTGGGWRNRMILDDGTEILWSGEYREAVPQERLVLAFTDVPGGTEFDVFTVTLVERDGATEMTLRQSGGHLTDEEYEEAKIGTASFLDELAAIVEEDLKMRHEST